MCFCILSSVKVLPKRLTIKISKQRMRDKWRNNSLITMKPNCCHKFHCSASCSIERLRRLLDIGTFRSYCISFAKHFIKFSKGILLKWTVYWCDAHWITIKIIGNCLLQNILTEGTNQLKNNIAKYMIFSKPNRIIGRI